MYCENPTIILKKNLYRILDKLARKLVYTDGVSIYPIGNKLPSPKSVGATPDNYKNWNVLTEDGELIPLFQQVACGNCILCRDKKAKAWSTRASCESASSTYPPIFITLTYDDEFLPDDGVNKKHLQNFIKRFRENWCRMFNTDRLDLRYFAVSEYGSRFGRPHYHLLFWNVPNDKINESQSTRKIELCVSRSWSEPVSLDVYKTLLPMHQVCFNGRYYRKFGRIEVTCDRGHSAEYCMKYMHKPRFVPSQWSQPTFYLSSRRGGGIGMRYLNDIIDSIREHEPHKTTILIKDVPHPYSLPRIFKEKLFPSLSSIIPTHIRCQLCRFEKIADQFYNSKLLDDFQLEMVENLRSGLKCHFGRAYDFINASEQMYHAHDDLICVKSMPPTMAWKAMIFAFTQCYEFQPDTKRLEYFISLKDKRQEILQKMKFPEFDVSSCVYSVRNRLISNARNDSF